MDLPLRHPLDVVVGRVGGLLREEERHALKHLVTVERRHRHVQEQPVQHGLGDVLEDVGEESH